MSENCETILLRNQINGCWHWNILFAYHALGNNGTVVCKKSTKVGTKFKRHILSGWISISHQRPRPCVRACLQYEKLYMFTMLLEREARINFNYSGNIVKSFKVCWWVYTVLLSWRDRERKWPHMTCISAHVIVSVPRFPAPSLLSLLRPSLRPLSSGSCRRRLESGWDALKTLVSPVALSTTFSRCSPTLRLVWGHISDLKQWRPNSVQTVVFVQKEAKCLVQTWIHITVLKTKYFPYNIQYT